MRKFIASVFAGIMCFAMALPCMADEFVNPSITDNAGYLDGAQLNELSVKLDEVRQKYGFEVAVYTETEMSGASAVETADDLYDYMGYGSGENYDGILFYICSGTRDYRFTTCADGMRVFNDNGLDYLAKNIKPHLASDDYYLAIDTYITLADELLAMAANGEPFNEKQYDTKYILIVIGCALLIPLLLAYIMMNSKLSKMKTAVANDYAANYEKEGSKQLKYSKDIFLYSQIVKKKKEKDSDGEHKSSSGRTHGGVGGKF